MIKCGKCKDRHETVAQVRECYATPRGIETPRRVVEMPSTQRVAMPLPKAGVVEDGMYRDPSDGTIYKVQWNRGSGDGRRLYAKMLVVDRLDTNTSFSTEVLESEGSDAINVRFVYAQGAMKYIRPEWKMTMEEAKAFGALYGICVRCGRDLTKEESIERGMGSTCVKYFS